LAQLNDENVDHLVAFIRASRRGFTRERKDERLDAEEESLSTRDAALDIV
jgi:hypothetical protein